MRIDELFQRIKSVSETMQKNSNRVLSAMDLTQGQAMILGFLMMNRNRKITQKDIEKNFGLSHATVNGFMRRMEKKELLSIRQDDCDKRFKVIEPTQKLLEQYEFVRQTMESFLAVLDSQISAQEQETLMCLLDRLAVAGNQYAEIFLKEKEKI